MDRIRQKSKFTESEASIIFRKLVSAVSFMHFRGVVHRDLKPENLLFTTDDDNAEIKVVDFGFARLKQEKESLHTPCFTLHYAAPEVLNGNSHGYDENCDLWSLGVILYTMMCGRAPFHAGSQNDGAAAVMARIKGGEFSFSSPAWNGVSSKAKNVVQGLLTVNPEQRLRMADLQNNQWVQGWQTFPQTPLMTPDMLSKSISTERGLQTTFNAFHKAENEGFRLQDVLNAKLAQRRRLKKSSSDNTSNFSCSFTSEGSLKSDFTIPLTSKPKSTDSKKTDEDAERNCSGHNSSRDVHKRTSASPEVKENVFCFRKARVKEYLSARNSSEIVERSSVSSMECWESKLVRGGRRKRKDYGVPVRRSERIRLRMEFEIDQIGSIFLPNETRKRKYSQTDLKNIKESNDSLNSPNQKYRRRNNK